MPSVSIEKDRCKGCELCNDACPQKILAMSKQINVKGYFFAACSAPEKCIGCMLCAVMCPDCAITIRTDAVQYKLYDY